MVEALWLLITTAIWAAATVSSQVLLDDNHCSELAVFTTM